MFTLPLRWLFSIYLPKSILCFTLSLNWTASPASLPSISSWVGPKEKSELDDGNEDDGNEEMEIRSHSHYCSVPASPSFSTTTATVGGLLPHLQGSHVLLHCFPCSLRPSDGNTFLLVSSPLVFHHSLLVSLMTSMPV